MSGLNQVADHQSSEQRAQDRRPGTAPSKPADPRAEQARTEQARTEQDRIEYGRWVAIGVALTAMTAVVASMTWLVLGVQWLGPALAACVGTIALAAWYTVSGRTLGMNGDVRERVLERHYIGVAWYGSMLRNTRERGGYERGLRRELTRLAAARLAEQHGVNLYRDPQAAAVLIGADLWPLVDPKAGAIAAAQAGQPGARPTEVPIRAVAELIERLERM
ncbi:hypothetical protein KGQ19_06270 [Catenulispora sp. NL8]|uniref:Integral membrane protein n=1 Tax=Catenulispora pinistramenti TaxID=2705254 RepID=A0ABS5KJ99_9ACTN|nr:hypothetical protein [Catenulispora pinistramenti]MBS2546466.1 hypothetical protein [Catenulispora pinistramenti]